MIRGSTRGQVTIEWVYSQRNDRRLHVLMMNRVVFEFFPSEAGPQTCNAMQGQRFLRLTSVLAFAQGKKNSQKHTVAPRETEPKATATASRENSKELLPRCSSYHDERSETKSLFATARTTWITPKFLVAK